MPQRGRKPQSCKALSKSKSTEHAVALCSECRRMRAKKPCHRVSNPQGCSCDYCGPNAPRQPTAASTPEVDVPPAPRKGRGTRRSSSHFDEHDATGSPLYTGSITDSARMELKLQQQRNLDYEQTRQDKKKPKLTCKGGAACDGDGCVDSTAEARSPSSASLESSLRMQRDLIDQLRLRFATSQDPAAPKCKHGPRTEQSSSHSCRGRSWKGRMLRYWWMVLRGWLPKQLASQYPTTTTYKTTMVERSKHTRRWCMCTSMSL